MDRNLLHEITEHVRSVKPGDRDDSGVAKLVDGLRTLARRQANEKLGMYEIMAKDMPAIAQQLGSPILPHMKTPRTAPVSLMRS